MIVHYIATYVCITLYHSTLCITVVYVKLWYHIACYVLIAIDISYLWQQTYCTISTSCNYFYANLWYL